MELEKVEAAKNKSSLEGTKKKKKKPLKMSFSGDINLMRLIQIVQTPVP